MNATRAYARATNETASPERLMVLLFEAALRQMRHAATLIDAKKDAEGLALITKASDIVTELGASLNAEVAPELTNTLGELYVFVAERLAMASITRTSAPIREAERAFAPIVDGFQQAVAQVSQAAPRPQANP